MIQLYNKLLQGRATKYQTEFATQKYKFLTQGLGY